MYRKFEGEADRSHHGPAPNRLYSTAHNMRTWISEGKVKCALALALRRQSCWSGYTGAGGGLYGCVFVWRHGHITLCARFFPGGAVRRYFLR